MCGEEYLRIRGSTVHSFIDMAIIVNQLWILQEAQHNMKVLKLTISRFAIKLTIAPDTGQDIELNSLHQIEELILLYTTKHSPIHYFTFKHSTFTFALYSDRWVTPLKSIQKRGTERKKTLQYPGYRRRWKKRLSMTSMQCFR